MSRFHFIPIDSRAGTEEAIAHRAGPRIAVQRGLNNNIPYAPYCRSRLGIGISLAAGIESADEIGITGAGIDGGVSKGSCQTNILIRGAISIYGITHGASGTGPRKAYLRSSARAGRGRSIERGRRRRRGINLIRSNIPWRSPLPILLVNVIRERQVSIRRQIRSRISGCGIAGGQMKILASFIGKQNGSISLGIRTGSSVVVRDVIAGLSTKSSFKTTVCRIGILDNIIFRHHYSIGADIVNCTISNPKLIIYYRIIINIGMRCAARRSAIALIKDDARR